GAAWGRGGSCGRERMVGRWSLVSMKGRAGSGLPLVGVAGTSLASGLVSTGGGGAAAMALGGEGLREVGRALRAGRSFRGAGVSFGSGVGDSTAVLGGSGCTGSGPGGRGGCLAGAVASAAT